MSWEWWVIIGLAIGHVINLAVMGFMLKDGGPSKDLLLQGFILLIPGGSLLFLAGVFLTVAAQGWSRDLRHYFRERRARQERECIEQYPNKPHTVEKKANVVFRVFPDGSQEVVSVDGCPLNIPGPHNPTTPTGHETIERQES